MVESKTNIYLWYDFRSFSLMILSLMGLDFRVMAPDGQMVKMLFNNTGSAGFESRKLHTQKERKSDVSEVHRS